MNAGKERQMAALSTLVKGLAAVGAMGLIASGSASRVSDESDDKSVRKTLQDYARLFEDGDSEGWLALWTVDGKQMAPNAPSNKGIDQIRGALEPFMAMFEVDGFTIDIEQVQILGEQAYGHGAFSYSIRPKEGGEVIDNKGKFLTIFKRQDDGSWKIAIDCFNSDLPAAR